FQFEQRMDEQRKSIIPIVAVARLKPNLIVAPQRDHSEAVLLDLVNPVRTGRGVSTGLGRHGSMKPAGRRRVCKRDQNMSRVYAGSSRSLESAPAAVSQQRRSR